MERNISNKQKGKKKIMEGEEGKKEEWKGGC